MIRAGEEVGAQAARIDLFELRFFSGADAAAARPAQASSTAFRYARVVSAT